MKPEEFLIFHIERIAERSALEKKFKLYFPSLKMGDHLPPEYGKDTLKEKQVDGIGTFLYFSRRGKMQFHEHILDIICDELKSRGIPYRRPNKKRGSDLIIGRWRLELEIRANPPKLPERRENLIQRMKLYPENTIVVLLNRKDKERYLHSPGREIITGNRRFVTVSEFLDNPPFP